MFDKVLSYLVTTIPVALAFSLGVAFARVWPNSNLWQAVVIYGPMWAAVDYYAWRKSKGK